MRSTVRNDPQCRYHGPMWTSNIWKPHDGLHFQSCTRAKIRVLWVFHILLTRLMLQPWYCDRYWRTIPGEMGIRSFVANIAHNVLSAHIWRKTTHEFSWLGYLYPCLTFVAKADAEPGPSWASGVSLKKKRLGKEFVVLGGRATTEEGSQYPSSKYVGDTRRYSWIPSIDW